jgi:hypothetical protein
MSEGLVTSAATSGDRRATLVAMRDKLARDMDAAPPAVVAQIAGRLSAILAELEQSVVGKVTSVDQLAKLREDRLAKADQRPPAKRQTRKQRP